MNGNLYDFLHVIFKRKQLLLLAFLAIFVPVAIATMRRPTLYRAAARLTVTQARAYPLLSPKEEPRNMPLNDVQLVTATVQNLQSAAFLRQASQTLAEHGQRTNGHKAATANWWARRLSTSLEVTPQSNSTLIDVGFRAAVPEVAAEIVNTVAKRYVYYQAQVMFDNPTLQAFYDEQRGGAEQELEKADLTLVRFQETANIYSLEEQKLQLSRAHTQALEEFDLNSAQIQQADAEAAALMARLKDLPAQLTLYTFGSDPRLSAVNNKVVSLELDLNSLRQLYTDEDRRVKNTLEQLSLARAMQASEADVAQKTPSIERLETNVAYQEIMQVALRQQATAEALRAKRGSLEQNVELAAERLRELNRLGYEYDRLKAARDAKKASFDLFLNRLEESRAAGAMDQAGLTNVQIVDYAAVPRRPVKTNKTFTVVVGLIGAFVVGVGGAFGLEALRATVHGPRDGETRLGVPVLGVVPLEV